MSDAKTASENRRPRSKSILGSAKIELRALQQRLQRGDGNSPEKILEELRQLWEKDFVPTTREINDPELPVQAWSEIEPLLYTAASRIDVRTVNGSARDVLDYVDNETHGLNVIAIGGDKLSRGLTLEGLSVSYYLRASRMYDTLMQMGRWFGYRPGYMDLCRLYTTPELVEWYEYITAASEELRKLFDFMASIGGTPADFGLRVQSHPDGLMITGAVKMRHSIPMELSFAGSISETIKFHLDPEIVKRNYEITERFVKELGEPEENTPMETRKWVQVPGQAILNGFLSKFKVHPEVQKVKTELLQEYIQQRLEGGELTAWTVALVSIADGKVHEMAGHKIGLIQRARHPQGKASDDPYRIRRLVNPKDEAIDLDDEQKRRALERTQEAWREDPGRSRRTEPPDIPSGLMIREVRSPNEGLLLIYPLDTELTGTTVPVIGFAISFPGSDQAQKVVYRVNNVYWQQEYGDQ